MMQEVEEKRARAIVAAVQLSSVSDVEFEASLRLWADAAAAR